MTTPILVWIIAAAYIAMFYLVWAGIAPDNHRDVNSNSARKYGIHFLNLLLPLFVYGAFFADDSWTGTYVVGGFISAVYVFAMWGFMSRRLG